MIKFKSYDMVKSKKPKIKSAQNLNAGDIYIYIGAAVHYVSWSVSRALFELGVQISQLSQYEGRQFRQLLIVLNEWHIETLNGHCNSNKGHRSLLIILILSYTLHYYILGIDIVQVIPIAQPVQANFGKELG